MSSSSAGSTSPDKYGVLKFAKTSGKNVLVAAGGGLGALLLFFAQEGVTGYLEDFNQKDEVVCFAEDLKVAKDVESNPNLARDQITSDPSASNFVSNEVYEWCGSPAETVLDTLEDIEGLKKGGT